MSVLVNITYYTTIYIGISIYTLGFSSSLVNIRILLPNRHNPCTFLLIYSSIVDCLVLNVGLLPRILSVGFSIDPTLTDLIWCKVRTYGLRITTLISLYTVSLMSIERFFVSCRSVRWRKLSNLPCVRWTAFIMTFIIAIEGLPFFILAQILRTGTSAVCTPMHNLVFSRYASFFCIPVLYGVLPLGIMLAMSLLTYVKLHSRMHLRRAQRILTLTILLRIVVVLLSCGPYTSYFAYSAIAMITVPVKSAERVAIENCVLSVITILLYVTYSSSFFIYYYVAPSYRKSFATIFRYCRGKTNTIRPMERTLAIVTKENAPIEQTI